MPDDQDETIGPVMIVRGSRGHTLPNRGSTAPKYSRGRSGGSVKQANPSTLRTSGMAPKPLSERPECEPNTSTFRPHPNAPPPPARPRASAPPAAVALPQPPTPAPTPAPAPTRAPNEGGSASAHTLNAPRYAKPIGDTTPNYVQPPRRAAPVDPRAQQPVPQGNTLTVEQLRLRAASGDAGATALLAQLDSTEV